MTNDGRPKFRRRRYFINRRLQSRFVAGFAVAVLLGFAANLLVAYFLIDRELTQELYKIHIKIRTTSEIAVPILIKLSAVTIPSILAASAAIGYFLTRRIELPLLELREAVERMAKGDFTSRLSNRLPGELPAAFNSMSSSLEAIFGSMKQSGQALELASMKLARPGRPAAELAAALKATEDARRKITLEISKLKV